MAKSFFDTIGTDRAVDLIKAGVEKAIQNTHNAGLPVTGKVNGVLSRVYPDGRVEPLSASESSVEKKTLSFARA